jgi:hypothetical protein
MSDTPERATDAPTLEALTEARNVYAQLGLTFHRPATEKLDLVILARALDAFAKAVVEKERERYAVLVAAAQTLHRQAELSESFPHAAIVPKRHWQNIGKALNRLDGEKP